VSQEKTYFRLRSVLFFDAYPFDMDYFTHKSDHMGTSNYFENSSEVCKQILKGTQAQRLL